MWLCVYVYIHLHAHDERETFTGPLKFGLSVEMRYEFKSKNQPVYMQITKYHIYYITLSVENFRTQHQFK